MTNDDRSVRYEPASGSLVLADRHRDLGPDAPNRDVLENYVDLVAECRGRPLGGLADVRDEDVDALAMALDVDASSLAAEIELVLELDPAQATSLSERLRTRRLALAGVLVAAGVVVGALVVGGPSSDPPTTEVPVAPLEAPVTSTSAAPTTTLPPVDATPSTSTDGDVTLIAPQQVERPDSTSSPEATAGP